MGAPTYSWDEDSAVTRLAPARWHDQVAGGPDASETEPTRLVHRSSWRSKPPPEESAAIEIGESMVIECQDAPAVIDEPTLVADLTRKFDLQPRQPEIVPLEQQLQRPPPRPAGQVFPIFGGAAVPARNHTVPMLPAVVLPPEYRHAIPPAPPLVAFQPTPRPPPAAEATPAPSTLPPYVRPAPGALQLPFGMSLGTIGAILGGFSAILSLVLVLYFLTPRNGQLRVELAADGGAPVTKAEIFVDGHKHCDVAPCIVDNLAPGARTIQVIAPGFNAPLTSSELVEAGKERIALIALHPSTTEAAAPVVAPPATPSARAPEPPPEPQAPAAAALVPVQPESAPAEKPQPRPVAAPPHIAAPPPSPAPAPAVREQTEAAEPATASGMGKLNVNSLPVSKVLVDGRALGSTPRVDITIPSGVHTVTFVHPDFGKRSVTVTVKPGQAATASVRFKK